ncbi:hypothetical protein K490DRAFT_63751 [Saccharata proteae CBS 121410]|uniref:Uncharacterized protein n=1 Tax=Saccharata proteae CBS 121410 TaxID=1314787 RepID=A0A6A5YCJ8_9PEZI|nr:hypothetical protein K490DRAFT_63751 [Saccharata proteae CBS 121410]
MASNSGNGRDNSSRGSNPRSILGGPQKKGDVDKQPLKTEPVLVTLQIGQELDVMVVGRTVKIIVQALDTDTETTRLIVTEPNGERWIQDMPMYFPFMKFPKELRDMIYNEIYSYSSAYSRDISGKRRRRVDPDDLFNPTELDIVIAMEIQEKKDYRRKGNALIFANKTIMREALPFYLKRKVFEFSSLPRMNEFLECFTDPLALQWISGLHFWIDVMQLDRRARPSPRLKDCLSLTRLFIRFSTEKSLTERWPTFDEFAREPIWAELMTYDNLGYIVPGYGYCERHVEKKLNGYVRNMKQIVRNRRLERQLAELNADYESLNARRKADEELHGSSSKKPLIFIDDTDKGSYGSLDDMDDDDFDY